MAFLGASLQIDQFIAITTFLAPSSVEIEVHTVINGIEAFSELDVLIFRAIDILDASSVLSNPGRLAVGALGQNRVEEKTRVVF